MKVKKTVTNKSTRFANKNEGISPIWVYVINTSFAVLLFQDCNINW